MPDSPSSTNGDPEVADSGISPNNRYVLRLYITGVTQNSVTAIRNTHALCEEHIPGNYDLEVVDLYAQPHRAKEAQIVASPTLVKMLPPPAKRLIGSMADRHTAVAALGIAPVRIHFRVADCA